jgi:hypothetical protein
MPRIGLFPIASLDLSKDGSSEMGDGECEKREVFNPKSKIIRTPISLEKVLHLGEPQERTFRSQLPYGAK